MGNNPISVKNRYIRYRVLEVVPNPFQTQISPSQIMTLTVENGEEIVTSFKVRRILLTRNKDNDVTLVSLYGTAAWGGFPTVSATLWCRRIEHGSLGIEVQALDHLESVRQRESRKGRRTWN